MIASFFGTGLILRRLRGADTGSGTVGSVFAFAVAWLLHPYGVGVQALMLAIVIVAALISIRPFASDHGDPGWVVIDEAAGTLLATLGLSLGPAILAWAVFRLADIQKHWFPGVAAAEEKIPGALGVTADDLVAGVYGLGAGLVWTLLR